jgi:hypothetical protein
MLIRQHGGNWPFVHLRELGIDYEGYPLSQAAMLV